MARIAITTQGTLGDLHPMFPIAETLTKRGHSVRFVMTARLQRLALNEGYTNVAAELMPDPPNETHSGNPGEAKARIDKYYRPFLERAIDVLTKACSDADVLLSTPNQVATAVVGQRLGIPWVTLTVFPGLIPSSYTVPEPHWLPALPSFAGRLVNRFTWSVFKYALRYLAKDAIDAAVSDLGTSISDKLLAPGTVSPYLCLVLSSPAYSPRQPDWPAHVKVTGSTPWDVPSGWREPPGLAAFISDGRAPIVVTSSTATERDAARFLDLARQAIQKTGHRGILLTGLGTQALLGSAPYAMLPGGVAAYPYLPLSRILPHASLVVHHAGIGTATAAIRHGLPAVAIPASFDQWYNAGRVRALGVGRVVRYQDLTVNRLAREIQKVAGAATYRARATSLAKLMEGENGASSASDEIEGLLRTWKPKLAPRATAAEHGRPPGAAG